jgi:endonuclease/exonuclease/phosphatase family metal-dependent hydrolase
VFQEAVRPDVVERLAKSAGMPEWAAREGYSLGFMSRLRIAHYEWYRPLWPRRVFLQIQPADTALRIFGVHLRAVHSNFTEQLRVRELKLLLRDIAEHSDGFHVMTGDFNTLAPGEKLDWRLLPRRLRTFMWMTGGIIRWETVEVMLEAHYVDGYRYLHPEDEGFTFPTWGPHVRLDYAFLPAPLAGRLKTCEVVKGTPAVAQASDHFPLKIELQVEDPRRA